MYYDQDKNVLEKLQSLDESTKKRILIIATAIIMVVVVYFWLAYFNNLVASIGQPATVAESSGDLQASMSTAPTAAVAGDAGFWGNMGNGMAFMYGQTIKMLHGLGSILDAPRQYIVAPPQ
jgi:hypothetical protein